MDFIESLGKQLSEITVYDVKSAYEKAKNMVMNYTEMEAKVREATSGDKWGASSTLMQEIAQATFNFQHFNEIMPIIYQRFTEKEAREWRQIYKALQLLEYLVKHGSERVVDDARSHLSMIKMLRNFHYIDEQGKDQGINVRNRSKELAELLSDLDRVRQERKRAKANRNKYTGVGNDGGPSFVSSTGSKYGGFGSESFQPSGSSSGYGNDTYTSSASRQRDSFDEYDAGDDEIRSPTASSAPAGRTGSGSSSAAPAPVRKDKPPVAAKPAKEVNLFDFDDDEPPEASPAAPATQQGSRKLSFDDDFDDFQSAVPSNAPAPPRTASAPIQPQQPAQRSQAGANFFDMMGPSTTSSAQPSVPFTSPPLQSTAAPHAQLRTSHNMPAGPNYSGVGLFAGNTSASPSSNTVNRPGMAGHSASFGSSGTQQQPMAASKPAASKGAFDFDDLFAASGAKTSSASKAGGSTGANSMASLAAQKQSSSLWGSSSQPGGASGGGNNNGDLLF